MNVVRARGRAGLPAMKHPRPGGPRPGVAGWAGLAATGVLAAACGAGGGYGTSAAAPARSTRSASGAARSAAVAVRPSALGAIVVDGSGRSLYLFAKDPPKTSTCYGSCAGYWPPALTAGPPRAGAGAGAGLVGTTARRDGSRQLTYAAHPLYYFVGDRQAGSTLGQGLTNFGAAWYVLSPQGTRITRG